MSESYFFDEAYGQLSVAALVTNDLHELVYVNPLLVESTGFTKQDLIGTHIVDLLDVSPKQVNWQGEVIIKTKNKQDLSQWLMISRIKYKDDFFNVYIFSKFKTNHYDPLTRLPNRAFFNEHLNHAIQYAKENETLFGLFYIDLDRFKFVNDTFGHSYGDLLLVETVKRIGNCIGEGNILARMGGDEFVAIINNIDSESQVKIIAQDILNVFLEPFILNGTEIFITASIGISIFPYDGDESEVLITNADTAMYRAKRKGKNQYEKAQAEINAGAYERLILENHLRKALENDQFQLYYQPQLDVKTHQITGMEALIRWDHPDFGIISPGEFIPIAEETGLILPIGDWVIRTACHHMKEWETLGYHPMQVSVNLSAQQFLQKDLIDKVIEVLYETQLDPQMLELEITESMVMHDVQSTASTLKQLKEIGVKVSIDDFGKGYSSLSYLKDFPIDKLKIDRSFIFDIDRNESSKALTHAITTLAHDLNLQVIAEGVETYKQFSIVKRTACDMIQGYYFSQPIQHGKVEDFLKINERMEKRNA